MSVSFALLAQRWDVVDRQMDAGLYVVKRTAQFVSKVAATLKTCSKELTRITENEKTKFDRLRADKNAGHVGSVVFLQSLLESYSSRMDEWQNQALQDIVKPLENFRKEATKRLTNIRKEHAKHQKKLDTVYGNMTKLHAEGLKHWAAMEQVKAQIAKGDPAGKHESKLQQLAKKGQGIFRKYEESVQVYRQAAQEHYDKIIVGLLMEMEKLERQRLEEVGNRLSLFAQLWNTMDTPLASTAEFVQITEELNAVQDLEQCIRSYAHSEDIRSGIPPIPDHLPCKSSDFDSDKWRRPDVQPAQRQLALQNVPCANNSVKEEIIDGQAPQDNRYDQDYGQADAYSPAAGYGHGSAAGGYADYDDQGDAGDYDQDNGAEGAEGGGEAGADQDGLYVQAVYALNTDDPDNLTFEEGDVICVTSEDVNWEELQESEPDWLTGYLVNDPDRNQGQFPSNYVVRCDPPL